MGGPGETVETRQALIGKMTETNNDVKRLKQELDDFDKISVSYAHEKVKRDKHRAFETVFVDLAFKYEKLSNEINLKMKQHLDLAMARKQTLHSQRESFFRKGSQSHDSAQQEQLLADDREELQLQGEIDFNERIINERQSALNDAEALMVETNNLVK